MAQAQAKRADVQFPDGAKYSYPNGPFKPDYNVLFFKDGSGVNFMRGNARAGANDDKSPLGPHTVTLFDASGNQIDKVDVPACYWNSAWNWPLAYPPIVNQPKTMMDHNWSFYYGKLRQVMDASAVRHVPYTKPMDMSDVTLYQPTTGERNDIGDDTEETAFYLLGGGSDPMLAWAKSCSSIPMRCRDPLTGKPVNVIDEMWNMYDLPGYQPGSFIYKGPVAANGYGEYGGGIVPQQAHTPDLSTEAAEATMSIQFLIDLQYHATFVVVCDTSKASLGNPIVSGEMRGWGWAMRTIASCWHVTKIFEDAGYVMDDYGLHDSTYWKKVLDANLTVALGWTRDPDNQVFRCIPPSWGLVSPWQCDYVINTLAYMVLVGLVDWLPVYLFALGNQTARTGGSDYPVGLGCSYRLPTKVGAGADHWPTAAEQTARGIETPLPQPADFGQSISGWKAAVDFAQKYGPLFDDLPLGIDDDQYAALLKDPTNGSVPLVGYWYLSETHAGLAAALQLDQHPNPAIKGKISAAYPNITSYFDNIDKMIGSITMRCALSSERTYVAHDFAAPPVVDPGQINNPPSNGSSAPPPVAPIYPAPTDLDPASYVFDTPAAVASYVTALPNVFIDLTGKVVPLASGSRVFNIKGDNTNVFLKWTDNNAQVNLFLRQADTSDGAQLWQEAYATGNTFAMKDCGGLNINGVQITPLASPPATNPDPAPGDNDTPETPPPTGEPPVTTNDNLSALATAVHAITSVKDSAVAALNHLQQRLAAMVAAAQGNGTQIDPAALQALVDELNTDKDQLATAIANIPQD